MFKQDIIPIIIKWCVFKIYLIVLIPNLKRTYDQSDQIDK